MVKKILLSMVVACMLAGTASAYTVKSGDTVSSLAKRFGVSQKQIVQDNGIVDPNKIFVGQNLTLGFEVPEVLGASRNYVEIPDSTLYSGAIVGDTSITLDQLVDIYGNTLTMSDFGDKGYGRINPEGNNISESFSFTGITANSDGTKTLTGVKHVLAKSPYTETSGITRSHGIGSTVRITNTAGFYNDFANKNNSETIVQRWFFSVLPETSSNLLASTTNQFVTKQYVDNISITGAPTSTESTAGRVKLGTQTQMASSTYDANDPTVVYTRYTTSTPGTSGKYVPVTESDGKLNQTFIDLSDSYSWSNTHTFNGSLKASSTFQSTQPLTVFSTTTSSTLPRVATDFISATTTGNTVTTTVTNNLQINGDIGATGTNFAKNMIKTGQGSQAANTTGNQVITHNLGFTPSLITIYSNASGTGSGSDISIGNGTATSASDETCTYLGHVSTAGAGTSASGQNASIICLYDSGGSAYARATLDAVDTTTFTLNWVTNGANGSSRYYQWAVYR